MKHNDVVASKGRDTEKLRFGGFLKPDLAQSFYMGSASVHLDHEEVLRALRSFLFYAAAARNDEERMQLSLISDLVGKQIRVPLAKLRANGKLETEHGDEQIHVIADALYRVGVQGLRTPGCKFRKTLVQLCFTDEFSQNVSFGGRSI